MPVEKIYDQQDPVFPVMIPNLNGDLDDQYMVEFVGKLVSSGAWVGMAVVPNGAGDGFPYTSIYATQAVGPSRDNSTKNGFFMGETNGAETCDFLSMLKIAAKSGGRRLALADAHAVGAGGCRPQRIASHWDNPVDNITSLEVRLESGLAQGRLRVWKVR